MECVFCGKEIRKGVNGNASKEHVFPLWLQTRLGIRGVPYTSGVTDVLTGEVDRRNHLLNTVVAKRVCCDCNNGWMSQLEQELQMLIEPVFQGRTDISKLSIDQQLSLARWTHKTTLAAFATGTCRIKRILLQHYREAASCNIIPAGLHVIGAHLGDVSNRSGIYLGPMLMIISSSRRNSFDQHELAESYSSVIQLGNTVLATVYCSAPVHYLWLNSRYHWPLWRPVEQYVWYQKNESLVKYDDEVAFWEKFMSDLMVSKDKPGPSTMRLAEGELIHVIPSPPKRNPNIMPPAVEDH